MAPSRIRRGLGSNRRGGWPVEVKWQWQVVVVVVVVVVAVAVAVVAHMPRPPPAEVEEATGIAAATIECGGPLCPNRGIVGEHVTRQIEKNIRHMYK